MRSCEISNSLNAALQALARDSGVAIHLVTGNGAANDAPLAEAWHALVREVVRATRYLGLNDCDSILVECTAGVIGLCRRPDGGGSLVVVSAPAGVPLGLTQRVIDRAAAIPEHGEP